MKNIALVIAMMMSFGIANAKEKEVTGQYMSYSQGDGSISYMQFKVNGKRRTFEGVGFDKAMFEKRKGESMRITYDAKYGILNNVYFKDGSNANNEKSINAKYVRFKGRMSQTDYFIFDIEGKETIFSGYRVGAASIKKNVGKVYHITYIENMDNSKIIQSISLAKKEISGKKTKPKAVKKEITYLQKFQKQCKKKGVPYCYIAKRYQVFDRACKGGDKLSCKHKKDLETGFKKGVEGGDTSYLQSLNYVSNNAKTSAGK